jgi:transcriptional regulator with XRE-family HTH domain
VADQIGVTACTIQYWETGRVTPAIRYIPQVIDFLGYLPFKAPETLGEQLIQRRKFLGLSQKETAKLLGIDPSNLAGWENDRHRPATKSIQLISEFLSCMPAAQE